MSKLFFEIFSLSEQPVWHVVRSLVCKSTWIQMWTITIFFYSKPKWPLMLMPWGTSKYVRVNWLILIYVQSMFIYKDTKSFSNKKLWRRSMDLNLFWSPQSQYIIISITTILEIILNHLQISLYFQSSL